MRSSSLRIVSDGHVERTVFNGALPLSYFPMLGRQESNLLPPAPYAITVSNPDPSKIGLVMLRQR
jgi:hypothetical protein